MRARDKLSEAEFFLTKAREARGADTEFRYYFNASVSAFRAIGIVLQKDCRSSYGARFDEWWDEAKRKPPLSTLPFDVLREIRNTSQKEGSRLPFVVLSGEVGAAPKEPVQAIDVVIDLSASAIESSVQSVTVTFTPGHPLLTITDENIPEEELNQLMLERVTEAMKHVSLPEVKLQTAGVRLRQDGPNLSIDDLLRMLDDHSKAWRAVLDEAMALFPPKSRLTRAEPV